MTARASLYTYLLVLAAALPATILVASNVFWGVWLYFIPALAMLIGPFIFMKWIPGLMVRRWLAEHAVEVEDADRKVLRHLAAHSGLPYTSAEVVEETIHRRSFYVSRKNRDMMLYLEDPVFADASFRHDVQKLKEWPDIELLRAAVRAGAAPAALHRRWQRSYATLEITAQSFVDGIPDEYFFALYGDADA